MFHHFLVRLLGGPSPFFSSFFAFASARFASLACKQKPWDALCAFSGCSASTRAVLCLASLSWYCQEADALASASARGPARHAAKGGLAVIPRPAYAGRPLPPTLPPLGAFITDLLLLFGLNSSLGATAKAGAAAGSGQVQLRPTSNPRSGCRQKGAARLQMHMHARFREREEEPAGAPRLVIAAAGPPSGAPTDGVFATPQPH